MRNVRVWLLMGGFTAGLVLIGAAIGGPRGMLFALPPALALNALAYFASSALVLKSWGVRRVDESEAPHFHHAVARVCERAGLPMPSLAIAPYPQPNAFVIGRSARHAVLCVTEEMLSQLDDDEFAGVIAHELGHIQNDDMLLQTLAAALAGTIADPTSLGLLFGANRRETDHFRGLASKALGPFAALVVRISISPVREFRADAAAARITERPLALASALGKLEAQARIPMQVPLAVALLAQVDPVAGHESWMPRLFATHPPVAERMKRLSALAERAPAVLV